MKNTKSIILSVIIMLISCLFIIFPENVTNAAVSAVWRCLYSVIPSLFGFMAISDLIIKTGINRIIAKPFSLISRYIFRIPEEYFPIFLISIIGGYPVGITLISELYSEQKISRKIKEKMSFFCFFPSPVFLFGMLGGIFPDFAVYTAYASIVLANIIIAVVSGIGTPVPSLQKQKSEVNFSVEDITSSVINAGCSVMKMSAIIVFFSSFIAAINSAGVFRLFSEYQKSIIITALEITNAPSVANATLPIMTALLSFGGVSVILQTISLSKKSLNIKKFLLSRGFASVISYILCYIATKLMNFPLAVSLSVPDVTLSVRRISPIPSIFLIIMTILLLNKKNSCQS